jgi:hypothetical protein
MSKFAQGIFEVKNPQKYVGKGKPRYRSGWEWTFMQFCDNNDSILQWASESVAIPYRNPITGKMTQYIPDFLVQYRTKANQVVTELIEIKPKKQSVIESKASQRDKAIVAVNYAKWDAAQKWARRNGLVFRVITEDDIFRNGKK